MNVIILILMSKYYDVLFLNGVKKMQVNDVKIRIFKSKRCCDIREFYSHNDTYVSNCKTIKSQVMEFIFEKFKSD